VASSSVTALKENLTGALAGLPSLSSVQVTYGPPLPNPAREYIWLGDVEGDEEPAALGRNRHREHYFLTVVIQSIHEGQNQQTASERAYALRDVIDTQLRTDPTVAGALGSGWAYVGGHFKLEELANDQQRGALLTIQVECEARI
jgi:hypothetical protein